MRLIALMLALLPTAVMATDISCAKVHQGVTGIQKKEWQASINRQLGGKLVAINQAFAQGDWIIVFADAKAADSPFLFFHGSPATTQFVTMWSGAATRSEQRTVRDWVLKNAPGIPGALASCFAWHVTIAHDASSNVGH